MSGMIFRHNLTVSNRVEHFTSQWAAHSRARTGGCFTDLALIPGMGDKGQVLVHRAVMLPLLPLLSDLTEEPLARWRETPVVLLPDTDLATVQRMVDLIYTGSCDISNLQQPGEVVELMGCMGLYMPRDRLTVDVQEVTITATLGNRNGLSITKVIKIEEGTEDNEDTVQNGPTLMVVPNPSLNEPVNVTTDSLNKSISSPKKPNNILTEISKKYNSKKMRHALSESSSKASSSPKKVPYASPRKSDNSLKKFKKAAAVISEKVDESHKKQKDVPAKSSNNNNTPKRQKKVQTVGYGQIDKHSKKPKKVAIESLKKSDIYLKKPRDVLTKSAPPVLSCPMCGKIFRYHINLAKHVTNHLKKTEKKKTEKGMTAHSMKADNSPKINIDAPIESTPPALSCSTCGKIFRYQKNLTKHITNHQKKDKSKANSTGEHTCLVCLKVFRHRNNLTSHSLTHSEERPFSCSSCPKTFRQRANLGRHTSCAHKSPQLDRLQDPPFVPTSKPQSPMKESSKNTENNIAGCSREGNFNCGLCEFVGDSVKRLSFHVLVKHRVGENMEEEEIVKQVENKKESTEKMENEGDESFEQAENMEEKSFEQLDNIEDDSKEEKEPSVEQVETKEERIVEQVKVKRKRGRGRPKNVVTDTEGEKETKCTESMGDSMAVLKKHSVQPGETIEDIANYINITWDCSDAAITEPEVEGEKFEFFSEEEDWSNKDVEHAAKPVKSKRKRAMPRKAAVIIEEGKDFPNPDAEAGELGSSRGETEEKSGRPIEDLDNEIDQPRECSEDPFCGEEGRNKLQGPQGLKGGKNLLKDHSTLKLGRGGIKRKLVVSEKV